jgi:hypothetical protein
MSPAGPQTNFKRWVNTSVNIADGAWHQVGVIYNGDGTAALLRNGVPMTGTTVTQGGTSYLQSIGEPDTGNGITISTGCIFGDGGQAQALIDELAIFKGSQHQLTVNETANLWLQVPVELSHFSVE